MAVGLTRRQRDLLAFIKRHTDQHGSSPSYEEMARAVGMASKSGIHRLLTGLEVRGRIERWPGHPRSVRLVSPDALPPHRFPADVQAALEAHARSQGVPPEVIVREAVRAYVGCGGASQ